MGLDDFEDLLWTLTIFVLVEGNYRGRGRWYPGKIYRVNRDGSYDIDYDDGEKESGVKKELIRAVGGVSKYKQHVFWACFFW